VNAFLSLLDSRQNLVWSGNLSIMMVARLFNYRPDGAARVQTGEDSFFLNSGRNNLLLFIHKHNRIL
jgi:hypothetical protein